MNEQPLTERIESTLNETQLGDLRIALRTVINGESQRFDPCSNSAEHSIARYAAIISGANVLDAARYADNIATQPTKQNNFRKRGRLELPVEQFDQTRKGLIELGKTNWLSKD